MRSEAARNTPENPDHDAPISPDSGERFMNDAERLTGASEGIEGLENERAKLEAAIAERSRTMLELSGAKKFDEVEAVATEIAGLQERLSALTEDIDRRNEMREAKKREMREGETTSLDDNLDWIRKQGEQRRTDVETPSLEENLEWIKTQGAQERTENETPSLDENLEWVKGEAQRFARDLPEKEVVPDVEAPSVEENLEWIGKEAERKAGREDLPADTKKSLDWIDEQEEKRVEAEKPRPKDDDGLGENLAWVHDELKKHAAAEEEREILDMDNGPAPEAESSGTAAPFEDERSSQRRKNAERLRRIDEGEHYEDERGAKIVKAEGLASLDAKLKKRGIDMAKIESSPMARARLALRTAFDRKLGALVTAYRKRRKERRYFEKRGELLGKDE